MRRTARAARRLSCRDRSPNMVTATTEAVAADLGVRLVDIRSAFDALLPDLGREALFILDGHPSARGYDLMAEVVARALLGR